jgi:tellurite resistance protein
MFKNLMKRLKGNAANIANSALAADSEAVMEAMIAAQVLTCYADGTCSNKEVDAANKVIKSSPQLVEFHNEPVRLFDSYCDQMEASFMMGKIDLMKKIEKIAGDTENAPRVLISAIEIAFADAPEDAEELRVSPEEEQVLSEIARTLDLKLGKYL